MSRTMFYTRSHIFFVIALLGGASLASADVARFTFTAEVSATLGATSFGFNFDPFLGCRCALMTVKLTGDTANVVETNSVGPDFALPGLTGSIRISSPVDGTGADANITGTLQAFSRNNSGVTEAGFALGSDPNAVFLQVTLFPPLSTPYDLTTPFSSGGAIFAPSSLSEVPTNDGEFRIDSITGSNPSLSWTETVTTPEPNLTFALGLGLVGLLAFQFKV